MLHFSGLNVLGAAAYFSATSEYSANDVFSPPNNNGEKFMIMAKVITGDYCKGNKSLKCAPYKKDQEFEQYDSVVDDESKPSMYAVFHDAAAYPEYIIKFKQASGAAGTCGAAGGAGTAEVPGAAGSAGAASAAGAAGAASAAGSASAAGAAGAADIPVVLRNELGQLASTYSGQRNSDPSCCVQ